MSAVGEYGIRYVNGQKLAGRMNLLLSLAGRDLGESLLSRVVQGSYNAGGVGASAGTHDGGGAVDLSVRDWSPERRWSVLTTLRRRGLVAWYRPAIPGLWGPHIHAVDRGARDLHWTAAAQVTAFERGRNGLANNGPDDGPKVAVPRFDYDAGMVEWYHGDQNQAHLVATWNCPHRLDESGRKRKAFLETVAASGVTLIAVQENTDLDPRAIAPDGWWYYRPAVERSAAILGRADVWQKMPRAGARQLHSDGWPEARYVVWQSVRNRFTGQRMRFASCHLVAFKTSRPANAAEFRLQEKRAAAWLDRRKRNVLAGDFNASPDQDWMPTMLAAGNPNAPLLPTGPDGQRIDHVWRPQGQRPARAVKTMTGPSDHKLLVVSLTMPA